MPSSSGSAAADVTDERAQSAGVFRGPGTRAKIQGLINNLMTFMADDLALITGPYDELLILDEVIEQKLILYVSLNVNVNERAVTALGRMLLQNLQLMIGKRYAEAQNGMEQPFVSVIMDEFSPFAYENFAHILVTARGANVAFLFALQSAPQLLQVGRGFRNDVASAPNTTFMLRIKDEETAQDFLKARRAFDRCDAACESARRVCFRTTIRKRMKAARPRSTTRLPRKSTSSGCRPARWKCSPRTDYEASCTGMSTFASRFGTGLRTFPRTSIPNWSGVSMTRRV